MCKNNEGSIKHLVQTLVYKRTMAFNALVTVQYYATVKGVSASCTRVIEAVVFPFLSGTEFGVSLLSLNDNQEFSLVCTTVHTTGDCSCELLSVGGNMELAGHNRTVHYCSIQFGNQEDKASFMSMFQ